MAFMITRTTTCTLRDNTLYYSFNNPCDAFRDVAWASHKYATRRANSFCCCDNGSPDPWSGFHDNSGIAFGTSPRYTHKPVERQQIACCNCDMFPLDGATLLFNRIMRNSLASIIYWKICTRKFRMNFLETNSIR